MILRNHVEWALHCCSILAQQDENTYIPTKDLAQFHGVPKEYLSKALQALAKANLIEGTLGPNGGYRLKKTPDKISFLDIVEAINGRESTFQCTSIINNNPCLKKNEKIPGICDVAKVMYDADEAWREKLRGMTLAKLVLQLQSKLTPEMLAKNNSWFLERQSKN